MRETTFACPFLFPLIQNGCSPGIPWLAPVVASPLSNRFAGIRIKEQAAIVSSLLMEVEHLID
jgi:hypothetical protein